MNMPATKKAIATIISTLSSEETNILITMSLIFHKLDEVIDFDECNIDDFWGALTTEIERRKELQRQNIQEIQHSNKQGD